jgi:hypothetical protein
MADEAPSQNRRVEELRWVTLHFRDLQGLIFAPCVFALLGYAMWVQTHGVSLPQLWVLPPGILCSLVGATAIQHWYTKHFGFVSEPEPQAVPSPVLSILHPAPARPRTRTGPEQRTANWVIAGIWVGTALLGGLGHRHDWFALLPALCYLLLPRCLSRTPYIGLPQMRRVLSIAAALLLFGLVIVESWRSILVSKWLLMYCTFGTFLVLAAYDHWLLTHLLGGKRLQEVSRAD